MFLVWVDPVRPNRTPRRILGDGERSNSGKIKRSAASTQPDRRFQNRFTLTLVTDRFHSVVGDIAVSLYSILASCEVVRTLGRFCGLPEGIVR